MTAVPPQIIGAGLAGLIAAHAWPAASVFEASQQPRAAHRALLRFRTDAVARLVGIEFRKVRVHKGLWAEGSYQRPAIRWANLYAQKVLAGRLAGDRSIWHLDPVERFIAPDDLYEQLLAAVGDRIYWGVDYNFNLARVAPAISTAPMPVVLKQLEIPAHVEFARAPITVWRCRIPGADVFQTVYFPERGLNVYRASITGETMIIEAVGEVEEEDIEVVERAFGVPLPDVVVMERVEQKYGKIAPIDDSARKALLFRLTHEHGVYSLGRFATWRNILLDDVVDDIAAIKKLMKTGSAYDIRRAAA